MMGAVVNHADQDKEHRRDRAVIEHLEHGAVDAGRGKPGQPQHHVSHVADRGVRDQLLVISLRHRAQRPVHDVDRAHDAQKDPRQFMAGRRQNPEIHPQDSVSAHLEQHAGQDHADCGGCLDVGVRQPGMEREGRNLDREADEQGDPGDPLEGHAIAARVGRECGHVKRRRRGVVVQPQHRQQDQDRAQQGVQEELDRGVFAPRAAPDADQEIHRQQHHFPEDVEQEEIQRHEHADHAGVEHQQQGEVALDALFDPEAGEHRDEANQRGQQHHRDADAVHADEVIDVVGGHPRILFRELDGGGGGVEMGVEDDRDQDLGSGRGHRDPADQAVLLLGTEHDHQQARDRHESNYGQQMVHLRRFYIT